MIKIAFFDIDGTLLRFRHNDLSEPVRSALKQLQKQGILLCMATGRSYPFIPRFEGIEFDVILSFNGSYVRNREEVIRKEPLTREDVNCIIGNLNKKKRAIAISNEAVVVTNGTDPDLEQYFAFGNEEMIISEKFNDISREDIYQIMCSCTKDEYEEILEGTKHHFLVGQGGGYYSVKQRKGNCRNGCIGLLWDFKGEIHSVRRREE